jgi:hypothetical protein
MTRARVKKFWLCRHNHPMAPSPRTGNWICYTCNELNLNHVGEEKGYCHKGHKRLINRECRVCRTYQRCKWLEQLDTDGTATCPKGHALSHHDKSLIYIKGKRPSRRCRICHEVANRKARQMAPGKSLDPMCKKGLHPRTPENTKINSRGERQCRPCWLQATKDSYESKLYRLEQKAGLEPQHVDWVVVERMLARGTMQYMRRGAHHGPTDGERWVAYCTFVKNAGSHPEELYGEPGYEAMHLYQLSKWRGLGEQYGWKEVTLQDILAGIPDPWYRSKNLFR